MDQGFDIHKLESGKPAAPGSLQDQCRAAVLGTTGIDKSEDVRAQLNLPKPLIDFLTKAFGTKDFFVNKDDVTAEDISSATYKAMCMLNKQSVLLKCIPNKIMNEENKAKIQTWRSKELCGIQKCLVSFHEGQKEIFVLDGAAIGLEEIISKCKTDDKQVDEASVWCFLKKITDTMINLQSKALRYEDLKMNKISIDSEGNVILSSPIRYIVETPNNDPFAMSDSGSSAIYTPPEIISGEEPTIKSDIWILGAILYEIAMLKPAYIISDPSDIFGSLNTVVEGNKPESLDKAFSSDLQSIIWSCLNVEMADRPALDMLLMKAEEKSKSADLKSWAPLQKA